MSAKRLLLGLLLVGAGLVALGWGLAPTPRQREVILPGDKVWLPPGVPASPTVAWTPTPTPAPTFTPAPTPTRKPGTTATHGPQVTRPAFTPAAQATATPLPPATPVTDLTPPAVAPLEPRLLEVEWPGVLRQGDSDWVRLTLRVDEQGNLTPTVQFGDHEVSGQPVNIPNLYDTHIIQVEARLDMAGVQVTPTGDLTERLYPGQPASLYWTLYADTVGDYRGVLSVHLLLTPKQGGEVERRTLAVTYFEVRVVNFLGLSAFWVRLFGGLSTVLGLFLDLPEIFKVLRQLRGTPQASTEG